jgi:ribosome-binding factor A
MPTQRQLRVADRLRREIAHILRREVEDPRVGFVTITDVEVSPDLKHARVFFSVLGDSPDEPREALRGLIRARSFIRKCLADQAELRFTPELEFRYDPTAERAQRIEMLLHQIAAERGPAEEGSSDTAEPPAPDRVDHSDDAPDHEEYL